MTEHLSQEAVKQAAKHAEYNRIVAVDPGDENSAYVLLRNGVPDDHGWIANGVLIDYFRCGYVSDGILAIETLHPRGELASRNAMETQKWAGRFIEAVDRLGGKHIQVDERDSRFSVTGRRDATNAQVAGSLKEIFGTDKQKQCGECAGAGKIKGVRAMKQCPSCKGRKYIAVPGPLKGYNEHELSALAAAVWYWQKTLEKREIA